jgi:hypothetical protein
MIDKDKLVPNHIEKEEEMFKHLTKIAGKPNLN